MQSAIVDAVMTTLTALHDEGYQFWQVDGIFNFEAFPLDDLRLLKRALMDHPDLLSDRYWTCALFVVRDTILRKVHAR